MSFLERAARLRPDEARYSYVYGVALHSVGDSVDALAVLEKAHRDHPGDRDILLALASVSRDAGALEDAIGYARKLLDLAPEYPGVREFVAQLESALAAAGS